jgi:hypothetical protein
MLFLSHWIALIRLNQNTPAPPSRCFVRCPLVIVRNLDQIPVRIPDVYGQDWPCGAGSAHRPFLDGHLQAFQMLNHLTKREGADEAQIDRTRQGSAGFGFEFFPLLMQIELLGAELESLPSVAEGGDFHPQYGRIEAAGVLDARKIGSESWRTDGAFRSEDAAKPIPLISKK